jgi:hypothetical protein
MMEARRFSASVLIGLTLGAPGTPSSLQLLAPGTLRTVQALHLPNASLGFAFARRYDTAAIVVKPVATGQPIRLVDTRTLRVTRVIQVGDRDVCGLTFYGGTLFALAANKPCYWPNGTFSVLRILAGRITKVAPVAGLSTVDPTNLAFGDGNAYIARAGGEIDVVRLGTGALSVHRPRRVLAKGEGVVPTRWLGAHLLGVGPDVVDTRTWQRRLLVAGARGIASGPGVLVAYGNRGAEVIRGTQRTHVLGAEPIVEGWVAGGYFYAAVGDATDVVDLRTGTRARIVLRFIELLPG